jgi:hypothetical protein
MAQTHRFMALHSVRMGEISAKHNPKHPACPGSAHLLPESPAVDLGKGSMIRGRLAGLCIPLEFCAK